MLHIDARIPVVFCVAPGPDDAVMTPVGGEAHAVGCACCLVRTPDASALDLLFLRRVRGEVPWFKRVVVTVENAELRAAIHNDPVLMARFRLQ